MAVLTAKARKRLKDDEYALPGRRYPIPDKIHARAALSRASEGLSKGWLSKEEHDIVVKKAKHVLGED